MIRLGLGSSIAVYAFSVMAGCGDDGGDETGASNGTGDTTSTSTSSSTTTGTATDTTTTSTATGTSSTTDDTTTSTSGSTGTGGSTGGTGTGTGSTGTTGVLADCHPILVEAVYDVAGNDDMLQWVRLYNPCNEAIDLAAYTIGYGGAFYSDNNRVKGLSGNVAADGCYIIGGPTSSVLNGDPTIDLGEDFMPSLDTATATGNGFALFEALPNEIDGTTVPLDAVIYGPNNDNNLIDATGVAPTNAMVANPPNNGAIQRTGMDPTWVTSVTPSPNVCPPF